MSVRITITIDHCVLQGVLNDSKTAKSIAKALPFEFSGNYWGDELYGTIPIRKDEENPVEVLAEKGSLAYWPVGHAFCIFWGPTPVSREGEMRAASPVTVIGRITEGLQELINTKPNPLKIRIEKQLSHE